MAAIIGSHRIHSRDWIGPARQSSENKKTVAPVGFAVALPEPVANQLIYMTVLCCRMTSILADPLTAVGLLKLPRVEGVCGRGGSARNRAHGREGVGGGGDALKRQIRLFVSNHHEGQ